MTEHKADSPTCYRGQGFHWVKNDGLASALRQEAEHHGVPRNMALLLTAADRLIALEALVEHIQATEKESG